MKKKIIIGFLIIFVFCITINSSVFAKKCDTAYYEITIPDEYEEVYRSKTEGDLIAKKYEFDDGEGLNTLYISVSENGGLSSLNEDFLNALYNYYNNDIDPEYDARINIIKKLEKINGVDCIHLLYIEGPKNSEFTTDIDIYFFASDTFLYELIFEGHIEWERDLSKPNPVMTKICKSFRIKDTVKDSNNGIPFTDVSSSTWYANAVKYTYNNNIISGTSISTFAPNNKLTRGMMATILYNMAGSPSTSGTSQFSDVKDTTKWYYKAVLWAAKNGVVSGNKDGTFKPNDYITREQLAIMLYNYATYKKKDTSSTNNLSAFSDKGSVANYALGPVKWAVANGVITGSNGKLNPKGNATRAEAASMIYKYCTKVGK